MSKIPHTRSAARAKAFQVLYSLHFTPATSLGALREAFTATPDPNDEAERESGAPVVAPSGFAWELTLGVWTHAEELDRLIGGFSQNWRVDRLGKIELTVLRIALLELFRRTDVPPKVVINEALDLTARFGETRAKTFINGVLDAAIAKLEAEQSAGKDAV